MLKDFSNSFNRVLENKDTVSRFRILVLVCITFLVSETPASEDI